MKDAALVKGWCPGALRPMESGDGLIVRLRLSGNIASPELAEEIAGWAENFGNGLIDLSARANLQLRGVTPESLPQLTGALQARGLLDASPEAEAVRNVLVAPFAPSWVRQAAHALEAELSRDAALWALPGKFGFAFDAGAYPLGEPADVAFESDEEEALTIRLGGAANARLGPFPASRAVAAAVAIAKVFLALRACETVPPRRMREAVARFGATPFAEGAGLHERPASPLRPARPPADWLGVQDAFAGFALPFGRIGAAGLRGLAKRASTELRLTPWRAILIPSPRGGSEALVAAAPDLDLIVDAADPRLRIVACPGAPGCLRSSLPTRETALRLAPIVAALPGAGPVLHISGCSKGCAHPGAMPYAVVGEAGGYNLVRNGRADGAPALRGVAPQALASALAAEIEKEGAYA